MLKMTLLMFGSSAFLVFVFFIYFCTTKDPSTTSFYMGLTTFIFFVVWYIVDIVSTKK